uniref:Uncharacterized protein n=1 Tax=Rhizophora mucronata TaxID=61149 RepID=A0A2P2PQ17_RHIMU
MSLFCSIIKHLPKLPCFLLNLLWSLLMSCLELNLNVIITPSGLHNPNVLLCK